MDSNGSGHVHVQLARSDGHSLEHGKMVQYRLMPFRFGVLISRDGIMIEGRSPIFSSDNFSFMEDVLKRARIHCEHLASFPVGTQQTVLTEEEVVERVEHPRVFNHPRLVS